MINGFAHSTNDLARREAAAIAPSDGMPGGFTPMQPLDVYARGIADEEPRVDALATISCGRMVDGKPRAARKGDAQWIYIHDENDRAPGLTVALQATGGRKLVVAFPFDDPRQFVMQRFAEYTQTALKSYGDERQVTEILGEGANATHVTHMAGTPEYERIVARCKVSVSVYFALAEWSADGPRVLFPDGLGMYRLRFTSRNTLRNLFATLNQTAQMTGGRIAGIPFDMAVDFRQVAGPDGRKRDIPVFTWVMNPPGGISSLTFRSVTGSALAQGEQLRMLAAPARETWETATLDGPVGDDVNETDVMLLERGGRCDKTHWTRAWHALVKGTSLGTSEGRAQFLKRMTGGQANSLAFFLSYATEEDAARLLAEAQDFLLESGEIELSEPDAEPAEQSKFSGDEYARLYGDDSSDPEPAAPVIETTATTVESEPVSSAEPDPSESNPEDDDAIDYAYCYEQWEANSHVKYAKPPTNARPALLRQWLAGFQAKLKEAAMT